MGDRCSRPRLALSAPSQCRKIPRTEEKRKTGEKQQNCPKPTQTEPWYFREPTVAGRAKYAFQENKTDNSQDIAQSMEPKPNQTPLFHTLEGLGTSHRKNIFESLET
jgi:hypothetical protein